MKNIPIKLIFILFCIIGSSVFSQGTYQNSGTQAHLNEVEIISDQTLYVGGEDGVLLKTTNGGDTWNALNFSPLDIIRLSFISSDIGYVCAGNPSAGEDQNSAIYKTVDGGISFDVLSLAGEHFPNHVHFIDEFHGFYSCFEGAFKTLDGGQNWSQVAEEAIDLIYFPTPQIGYGVSPNRELLKSTNAGQDWLVMGDLPNGEFYSDLTFPSADTGFTCSSYYGAYGSTSNGGQTISVGSIDAHSMHFPTNNKGYFLRYDELEDATTIGYTLDLGETWNTLMVENVHLNHIRFTNNTSGWAVGDNGTILKIDHLNVQVSESMNSSKITVYPNPASETIFVEMANHEQLIGLQLFNTQGKLVKECDSESMSIANLPTGIYFLKIITNEGIVQKQIIKD